MASGVLKGRVREDRDPPPALAGALGSGLDEGDIQTRRAQMIEVSVARHQGGAQNRCGGGNQFIPETEKVFNLGETDKFDVEIDTIKFSDGTSVSREAAD